MIFMRLILLNMICLFLVSCGCYKVPTTAFIEESSSPQNVIALNHWLYDYIPRHRCQIKWFDLGHWTTWMLFGNDDEGVFGEGAHTPYRPNMMPSFTKATLWTCRNPFHNFCHYVIGSANRQNSEFDILSLSKSHVRCFCYRPIGYQNFPSQESCFYLALHGGKPFISFRIKHSSYRKTEFYFGWRYNGGFGCRFHPFKEIREKSACFTN